MTLEGINPKQLLHAYLIEGSREAVLPELNSLFERVLGATPKGNPNVYIYSENSFTIEQSRTLQSHASKRALGGGKKLFALFFQSITHEAQNALLKLFEEPTQNTHFFVITPSAEILLPTLRSRLLPVTSGYGKETIPVEFAKTFLVSNTAKRFMLLKDIIGEKDKASAIRLLDALEQVLYERGDFKKGRGREHEILKDIQIFRQYLRGRAPSVKMILEQVAITTPREK